MGMSSELIKNLHALNYGLNKSLTIGIHYPVHSSGIVNLQRLKTML